MANNLQVKKRVFNQSQFDKVIDREFKTFKKAEPAVDPDTVEEFFRLYDKLYYVIPTEGEEDSHQFLIQESSKLVDYEKTTEEIQPLLDEITQLRLQLVEANNTIQELESEIAQNGG